MGPLLRNHSSTVTRATRPLMLTCTALRRRSTGPFGTCGTGRTGSIQPCASKADEMVHSKTAAPNTRDVRMDCTWLGTHERRTPLALLHTRGHNPFRVLGLRYRTLVGTRFHDFRVRVRRIDETKIGLLDLAICIGEGSLMVGDPLQKHPFILDCGGFVGSADHIEAGGYCAIGAPLALAGVMGGEHQQVPRPRLSHTLQTLPQQSGPRL